MKENENEAVKQVLAIANEAAKALESKKGLEVKILEVGSKTIIADYFVIATGTSNTHVKALADEVKFKLEENLGIKPYHSEGFSGSTWTLIDYASVVVHIFTREARDFYKLEKLWSDSEAI